MHFDPVDSNLCVLQFGVFGDVNGTLSFMLGSAAVIKIRPDGSRDTIAQGIGGLAPSFAFDEKGNLYVADLVFGQILKYNLVSSTKETPLAKTQLTVFPNPASEQVNIEYELTREAPVTMGIYDLGGRLLASWDEGNMPSGKHRITWNGKVAGSRVAQNGTYIFRLLAGGALSTGVISWQRP